MTKTVTTGKATDLITFTRSTTGTYLDSVKYGDELVTNGTFDSDSDWIFQTGKNWTISNGKLNAANSTGYTKQNGVVENNKTYKVTLDAVVTSGSFRMVTTADPSTYTSYITTSGSYVFIISPVSSVSGGFEFIGTGFTGSIDNVSVKEVIGNQGTSGEPLLRTADTNEPRIEYDADGNLKGLLIEEARTNILPQSIANANWGKIGVSITENFATAPDESSTAYKISEATTNSIHYAQQTNIQFTSGITYTESLIAKAGTNSVVQLLGTSSIFGSLAWANFDLSDGTIGSKGAGANAAIKPLGNGWYRCSLTMTATVNSSASAGFIILVPNKTYPRAPVYQGNSDNHIYAWGIQTEAGTFPTSYIPTSGSTVTRNADVATINVSEFEYNTTEGTVVVNADSLYAPQSGVSFSLGSFNNGIWVAMQSGAGSEFACQNGSVAQFAIELGSLESNTFYKTAGGYKLNDSAACRDGGAVVSDDSCSIPSVTTAYIGALATGSRLNGHIKSIKYYPVRLTNNQLKALTQ